jgi:hypothetical protein
MKDLPLLEQIAQQQALLIVAAGRKAKRWPPWW